MLRLVGENVTGYCPDCGAYVTFEHEARGKEFGLIMVAVANSADEERVFYRLLRCASCGRGAISTVRTSKYASPRLLEFYPVAVQRAPLPETVPDSIVAEFREAESCLGWGFRRAASALFRSALEKTLKANGYSKGTLENKIDKAAEDGIVTMTRRKRAHDEIRVLGNDVLHDEWRKIEESEAKATRHYAQRILEDFYDDRDTVEEQLRAKKRLPQEDARESEEQNHEGK